MILSKFVYVVSQSVVRSVGWSVGQSVAWLVTQLVARSVGHLVSWLVTRSLACLLGRSLAQSVVHSLACSLTFQIQIQNIQNSNSKIFIYTRSCRWGTNAHGVPTQSLGLMLCFPFSVSVFPPLCLDQWMTVYFYVCQSTISLCIHHFCILIRSSLCTSFMFV